ncbi:MAG: hypothetical protein DME50_01655 [Verrucomicrobia bacterium]|nr:MAG: hypothetical protein DME50_01655 [Verrucomicrobiota bacterium]
MLLLRQGYVWKRLSARFSGEGNFHAPKIYAFGRDRPKFALALGDLDCVLCRGSSPQLHVRKAKII